MSSDEKKKSKRGGPNPQFSGNKTKVISYDENAHREFVLGFSKRRKQRQARGQQQVEAKLKQEMREKRQDRRDAIKKIKEIHQAAAKDAKDGKDDSSSDEESGEDKFAKLKSDTPAETKTFKSATDANGVITTTLVSLDLTNGLQPDPNVSSPPHISRPCILFKLRRALQRQASSGNATDKQAQDSTKLSAAKLAQLSSKKAIRKASKKSATHRGTPKKKKNKKKKHEQPEKHAFPQKQKKKK
mmetsp:Transcript_9393/g.24650  ORF Transcript_9393/g.24650 Transcript_9393/m.24650 type:complete len:243 (-) Transcript_9393:118-846(-)